MENKEWAERGWRREAANAAENPGEALQMAPPEQKESQKHQRAKCSWEKEPIRKPTRWLDQMNLMGWLWTTPSSTGRTTVVERRQVELFFPRKWEGSVQNGWENAAFVERKRKERQTLTQAPGRSQEKDGAAERWGQGQRAGVTHPHTPRAEPTGGKTQPSRGPEARHLPHLPRSHPPAHTCRCLAGLAPVPSTFPRPGLKA